MTTYGYRRVSTDEQADSGLGLDAQAAAISAAVTARGLEPVEWITDPGVSGSVAPDARPALGPVLAAMRAGDVLVVSKLDRLSRSVLDFAHLMDRAQRERWSIVCLDLGVDTTTPAGELMANVMAGFAHYERRVIGQRTRDALAERKRQGVRLGRPRVLPAAVLERIAADRAAGLSLRAIADALTAEEVPTAHGGARWHASTVRAALLSLEHEPATA